MTGAAPFVLLTVVMWGVYGIISRQAVATLSPTMVMVVFGYVYSAIAPMIFMALKITGSDTSWNAKGTLWAIAACVTSALGTLSFQHALTKGTASLVVAVTAAYPLVTLILSWAFLGERLDFAKALGVFMITLGIVIVSR